MSSTLLRDLSPQADLQRLCTQRRTARRRRLASLLMSVRGFMLGLGLVMGRACAVKGRTIRISECTGARMVHEVQTESEELHEAQRKVSCRGLGRRSLGRVCMITTQSIDAGVPSEACVTSS